MLLDQIERLIVFDTKLNLGSIHNNNNVSHLLSSKMIVYVYFMHEKYEREIMIQ
jgi:hypothetical protein